MRRHGLKEAARYFGFARSDREYVEGVDVWPTFRTDPERIRRYAAHDVDEVDGLSRRLLPAVFGLTGMLPRAYERIAADCGAASLWELLLVRAYLHAGRAIAAPTPRLQAPGGAARAELFLTGVVGPGVLAAARPLLPCVVSEHAIAAANDSLGLMPALLGELLEVPTDESRRLLAAAGPAYLAGQGLFRTPTRRRRRPIWRANRSTDCWMSCVPSAAIRSRSTVNRSCSRRRLTGAIVWSNSWRMRREGICREGSV